MEDDGWTLVDEKGESHTTQDADTATLYSEAEAPRVLSEAAGTVCAPEKPRTESENEEDSGEKIGVLELKYAKSKRKSIRSTSSLHYPVAARNLGLLKSYLEEGADVNGLSTKAGPRMTPLIRAVRQCVSQRPGAWVCDQYTKEDAYTDRRSRGAEPRMTPIYTNVGPPEKQFFDVDSRGRPHYPRSIERRNTRRMVALLLRYGATTTLVDDSGWTALDHAKESNDDMILQLLVGNIEPEDNRVVRLIDMVCTRSEGQIKVLLENDQISGEDVIQPDVYGLSILDCAVQLNMVSVVEMLLKNKGIAGELESRGPSYLATTILAGLTVMPQILLNSNVDPNQIDSGEYSTNFPPLILAVVDRNLSLVESMLQGGADPNIALEDGSTPLTLTDGEKRSALIQSLKALDEKLDCMIFQGGKPFASTMPKASQFDMLSLLLKSGASPRTLPGSTFNFLVDAVGTSTPEVIELLIIHGAHLDKSNEEGYTPLMMAVSRKRSQVLDLLLKAGADPNAPNTKGQSPLAKAIALEDFATVKVLLESGADPKKLADGGASAVEKADSHLDEAMLAMLVKHGACVRSVVDSPFALRVVVKRNLLSAAESLLASGADPNCEHFYNPLPLIDAVSGGHKDMTRLLLANGADPDQADRSFQTTALEWAIELALGSGPSGVPALKDTFGPNVFKNAKTTLLCAIHHASPSVVSQVVTAEGIHPELNIVPLAIECLERGQLCLPPMHPPTTGWCRVFDMLVKGGSERPFHPKAFIANLRRQGTLTPSEYARILAGCYPEGFKKFRSTCTIARFLEPKQRLISCPPAISS